MTSEDRLREAEDRQARARKAHAAATTSEERMATWQELVGAGRAYNIAVRESAEEAAGSGGTASDIRQGGEP